MAILVGRRPVPLLLARGPVEAQRGERGSLHRAAQGIRHLAFHRGLREHGDLHGELLAELDAQIFKAERRQPALVQKEQVLPRQQRLQAKGAARVRLEEVAPPRVNVTDGEGRTLDGRLSRLNEDLPRHAARGAQPDDEPVDQAASDDRHRAVVPPDLPSRLGHEGIGALLDFERRSVPARPFGDDERPCPRWSVAGDPEISALGTGASSGINHLPLELAGAFELDAQRLLPGSRELRLVLCMARRWTVIGRSRRRDCPRGSSRSCRW